MRRSVEAAPISISISLPAYPSSSEASLALRSGSRSVPSRNDAGRMVLRDVIHLILSASLSASVAQGTKVAASSSSSSLLPPAAALSPVPVPVPGTRRMCVSCSPCRA